MVFSFIHMQYCIHQTYFQQLVHTTASMGVWVQVHCYLVPEAPWRADLYFNSRETATGNSHGNTGEVLAALIINSVKLIPKGTSLLPSASQKRKWIYISRSRLLPTFLLHKWIARFPFKHNFPKKIIGKLSTHTQNVPKVGRSCSSAKENISLFQKLFHLHVPYSDIQKCRTEDICFGPGAIGHWAQELLRTGTHLQTGQSRLYSQEWGILAVRAAHTGLWFQLTV